MEAARRATRADLDVIAALVRDATDEQRDARGGAIWARREARAEPVEHSLHIALEAPEALLVAGTLDEVVVGYAVAHLERLRTEEVLAVVEDLVVDPDARGIGVGEAMMDLIVEWATEHHCIGVDALVLPGNRASKNFFETFGLTARAIVVHRSLGPGPRPQS